jgi:hypothetical protein
MRDEWCVELELDSHRASIAKSAPGRDRDENAPIFSGADRGSIGIGHYSFRIEKSSVEIKGEEFYHSRL